MDTLDIILHALQSAGLSAEESSAYFALVKNGAQNALALSRATDIPRTSIYRTLDSLANKSLVRTGKKGSRTLYFAEPLQHLLDDLQGRTRSLEKIAPQVDRMLFSPAGLPEVRFFAGKRGFVSAFHAFYDRLERLKVKQVYSLSHPDLIAATPRAFNQIVARRESLKIKTFLLMPSSIPHPEVSILKDNALREIRYVPQAFEQNNSMLIGGDTIIYLSLPTAEFQAVLLVSEPISYLLREFFKVVWGRVAISRRRKS